MKLKNNQLRETQQKIYQLENCSSVLPYSLHSRRFRASWARKLGPEKKIEILLSPQLLHR